MPKRTHRQTVLRGFRTEIRPNQEQVVFFGRCCGTARWVWNWALARRKEAYEKDKKTINSGALMKEIRTLHATNPEYAWLREVDARAIEYAVRDLDTAFKNFFRRVKKGEKPGYPKFKARRPGSGRYSTISSTAGGKGGGTPVDKDRIRLPKIGWIRLKECDYIPAGRNGHRVTVSEGVAGRWFVTVLAEEERACYPDGRPAVGIDLGLRTFAVLSDGVKIPHPHIADKASAKVKRLQRILSRKKRGSQNRNKARERLAIAHWRLANTRRHWMHETTTAIVKDYGTIVLETLGIKDLLEKSTKRVSREISDAAWFEFRRQIEYKGLWHGTDVIPVSRWFPSTRRCSECGADTEVSLEERTCTCRSCGLVIDRDENAAANLLQCAEELHKESAAKPAVHACGGVPMGMPMKQESVVRGV